MFLASAGNEAARRVEEVRLTMADPFARALATASS